MKKVLLLGCCLVSTLTFAKYCPVQKSSPQRPMTAKSAQPAPTRQVVKKAPTQSAAQKSAHGFDLDAEWKNMERQIKQIDPNIPDADLEGMRKDFNAQVESEMSKHMNN
jgi:hypothetical protein